MASDGNEQLPSEEPERAGSVLGPYVLRERLGEGGFGTVWVAEQERPVRRRVALKLLKAGMASREILTRFAAERQALALMDHPGIAGVLDAGTTPSGSPYFVMEYVDGRPITAFADHGTLDLRARLELFCRVCLAVQHAHHKGVVHRDLKPDNVLVAAGDGEPLPRVIDFGIAKALETPLVEATLQTGAHQIMGTPAYMSPEQAVRSADVDTRADVYSLGAMLYELLCGGRVFEWKSGRTTTLEEMLRFIREVDPPPPSERVKTLDGERARSVAAWRGTTPDRLSRSLRRELDWIVMRALEKDRERRYESPGALADDVQRYLRDEPVLAGPPSTLYRMIKFARRNRGLAAGLAVAAMALVGAVGVLAWSVVRVADERDEARDARAEEAVARLDAERSRDAADAARRLEAQARTEAEVARDAARDAQALAEERQRAAEESLAASRAVTSFLGDTLAAANPRDLGLDATVLDVLDRAAPSIGARFADRPYIETELRSTVGTTYRELGRYPPAREHLERALELATDMWGDDHPETLLSRQDLVVLDREAGRAREALAEMEDVYARLSAQLPTDDERCVDALSVLGMVRNDMGDYEGALAAWQAVLDAWQRLGARADVVLAARHNLAIVLGKLGDYEGKLAQFREIHAETEALLGLDHPNTLDSLNGVAGSLQNLKRYREATEMLEDLLDRRRRVLGPDHPTTLTTMINLVTTTHSEGRYAYARGLAEEGLEACRRVLGPDHTTTLLMMDQLGVVLTDLEQYEEARLLLEESLEGYRRALGPEHDATLRRLQNLAYLNQDMHRYLDAVLLFEELVEVRERVLGPKHPESLEARYTLAGMYIDMVRAPQAAALLRPLLEDCREVFGYDGGLTENVQAQLAWALVDMSRYDEAEDLFLDVYDMRAERLGPEHELTVNVLEGLAKVYGSSRRERERIAICRTLFKLAVDAAESPDATPLEMEKLSWYFTEGPVEDVYDARAGVVWAERANEATGWSVPRYLDRLAAARSAAGDDEGAIEAAQRAVELTSVVSEQRLYLEDRLEGWKAAAGADP